jgi:hypothetical protein
MRKLFKERKLFKGGNYMRKYGIQVTGILPLTFYLSAGLCSGTNYSQYRKEGY